MTETTYTPAQLRAAARRAMEAGDVEAARKLIARGQAMEAQMSQPLPPSTSDLYTPQNTGMFNNQSGSVPGSVLDPVVGDPTGISTVTERIADNVVGLDNGVFSAGEQLAAAANKAGESMTFSLIGDEVAGEVDELIGRREPGTGVEFFRAQERQLDEQNPALAITADIGGALALPGVGGAKFINQGAGALDRIARGGLLGTVAGATTGAMEGESTHERLTQAATGAAVGTVTAGALTGVGQGFNRTLQALSRKPEVSQAIPSVAALRDTAASLYRAADESGAVLGHNSTTALYRDTLEVLAERGYNSKLHPRLGAVLTEMQDLAQGSQPITRIEQLRRIAANAAQSVQPDERRLGSIIIRQIDEAVEKLPDAAGPLKAAREVWGRIRRMEAIEGIVEQASNARNFDTALATGFRSFLRKPANLRSFTEAERKIMKTIASGSGVSGALLGLSKRLSLNSMSGLTAAGGVGYAFNPAAGVMAPATGLLAGFLGRSARSADLRKLSERTRMPAAQKGLLEAFSSRSNPLAQTAAPGGLLATGLLQQ